MNTKLDFFTAIGQFIVTLIWLVGLFTLLILEGLGKVKDTPKEALFAATGVVLYFWFNRQRNQESDKVVRKEEKIDEEIPS